MNFFRSKIKSLIFRQLGKNMLAVLYSQEDDFDHFTSAKNCEQF